MSGEPQDGSGFSWCLRRCDRPSSAEEAVSWRIPHLDEHHG
ncbi:MAG: hypothetical protein AAFY26_12665 [Cyanobacteria bacterium J06638_22]